MKSETKCWLVAAGLFLTGALILFARVASAEPVYVNGCSGTYIGEGYVLTAGHCISMDSFVAKTNPENDEPGTTTEKYTVQIVWVAGGDYGLYKLDKALVKRSKTEREDADDDDKFKKEAIKAIPFTATKVFCGDLKIGEKLHVSGWPAGQYTEFDAVVASPKAKHMLWPKSYLAASPGFYGSSGSGMLNAQGEVAGILVGGIVGSGVLAFVPTSEICTILPREIK